MFSINYSKRKVFKSYKSLKLLVIIQTPFWKLVIQLPNSFIDKQFLIFYQMIFGDTSELLFFLEINSIYFNE